MVRASTPHSPLVNRVVVGMAVVFVGVLVACGNGGPVDTAAPRPSGGTRDDVTLLAGRDVWIGNCTRCHGQRGQGGVGPRLAGVVTDRYPDVTEQITLVESGRGIMPAWEGRLTAEEIAAVVRYTREVLK